LQFGTVILRAVLSALLTITIGSAQQAQQSTVPRLIQFSGVLKDNQNKPLSGTVTVTFSIYAGQQDNSPLWSETQQVALGPDGSYTALLGSASEGGVPAELFSKAEARWLGIQTPEQMEGPRILLASVPYALKAADAETLGGKPAAAYLTTDGQMGQSQSGGSAATAAPLVVAQGVTPATTPSGSGVADYIPLWTNGTTLGDSILFQSGTAMQVNGTLALPALGTATSSTGYNSRSFDFFASAYNSSSKAAVAQHFRWEAEPVSSNTSSASGKIDLLYASGTGTPAETGLSISSKGILTFAAHQTLPAVSGSETVSGNVSAAQLISTVAQGTAPLKVTSTTQVANLNASYLDGLSAGAFALRGAPNTFLGTQTISGALNLTGPINSTLILQASVHDPSTGNTSANVIGGFPGNTVTNNATGATIGGGGGCGVTCYQNAVSDDFGTVGGGLRNTAGAGNGQGSYSTVGGGDGNIASGQYSTVGGGAKNTASGQLATMSGGDGNTASGTYSTVGGGIANAASGSSSTVPGGGGNTASGQNSFAAGYSANAVDDNSFVWCQLNGNTCTSIGTSTFTVAVQGPIFFSTPDGSQGCILSPGSSGWSCTSDRNLKNNIRSIDSRSVLERVARMPISEWSMKSDKDNHNHIGPMAQDFYVAFGLGDSDKYIAQGDAQGVALASIQGLYRVVQEKDRQIRDLTEQLRELQQQIKQIAAQLPTPRRRN
jgi:hypothetical protein